MKIYKIVTERLSEWHIIIEAENENDALEKFKNYDCVEDEYEANGISEEIKKVELYDENKENDV